ncbi:MAG: hypothetical protein CVT70_17720 [Alphaproteobacteria bacterium HGW-Alphaproteobacteria-1]|jgi:hypothetical protein|nr:MAG: hypothetical protein CVT70_17720 [Alphaproteobacteria bacterium HGW-Alphaproteobacteria-1]
MTAQPFIIYRDIKLALNWQNGGLQVEDLPARPGIYAEVYKPLMGVRIGETGVSIRGKIRHDIRWFNSMRDGTAPQAQLRRTLPIAQAAKATGAIGFEFHVVSVDLRLADKKLRQDCERFLFDWVRRSDGLTDWNRQRSWR